jgi:hypothetical protein
MQHLAECMWIQVSIKSAMCHQVNASFKFRIGACKKWPSDWNNYPSHCGPLVHSVISGDVLWTVHAQITPVATSRWLRSNPKAPFTSAAISILLAHTNAISCDSLNLHLGFFPLPSWSLLVWKCSKNRLQMRTKSRSWFRIISFLIEKCSNSDQLMGKISLHWICNTPCL